MTTWTRGRSLLAARLRRGELSLERLIGSLATHPQARVPGTAVYLFPEPGAVPPALLANLRHNEVLHETVLVVAVRTGPVPRVPHAARAAVHEMGEGFYQVVLTYGFFEPPDVPSALSTIVAADFGFDPTDAVYVVGRETVIPSERPGMALWRDHLFSFLQRNASAATGHFQLPVNQVIEVGSQVEI